jgi:hypothetical protein
MAVELSWYEEGRVVYQRFRGVLAMDDVETVARALKEQADQGIAPVHAIVDVRQVTEFPASISQISSLRGDGDVNGWMVVIGLHPAVRSIARVMSWLRGVQYRPVASMEDALRFLARQDAALGHLVTPS